MHTNRTTEDADVQKRRLCSLRTGQNKDGSDNGKTDKEQADTCPNRFSCDLHGSTNSMPILAIDEIRFALKCPRQKWKKSAQPTDVVCGEWIYDLAAKGCLTRDLLTVLHVNVQYV